MNTTQESGQHLVVFVAAGNGSDADCDAVARKLSEKFGAPYERMLASVRQSPRVFKRNLTLERAESCADLLRSMGAVAEVQLSDSAGENAADLAPLADIPDTPETVAPVKPPPPQVTDRSCPFCGRALRDDGICIICKPKELSSEPVAEPEAPPEPATAPETAPPEQEAGFAEELPVSETVTEPDSGFQDSDTFEGEEAFTDAEEWPGPTLSAGVDPLTADSGPVQALEASCANCGGLLNQDGLCPTCDLGAAEEAANAASISIENDLSAMLTPEELGVCPNCCGPMEQDGTCLICPPAALETSPSAAAPAADEPGMPTMAPTGGDDEITLPAFNELAVDDLVETETPPEPEMPASAQPASGVGDAPSPFEPLTPLGAEPPEAGTDICRGCGGPKGSDGTCLICGESETGGSAAEAAPLPEADEMTVMGNEPPPAEPAASEVPVEAVPAEPPDQTLEAAVQADQAMKGPRPAEQKPAASRGRAGLPRSLTILLLATLFLLVGGIALAMTGSFLIASGVFFLALIAGLVTVFKAIRHFEQTMDSFPRLPMPVIVAFIAVLFLAGSGSIAVYTLKQSALFLVDKASEELRAETDRRSWESGQRPGSEETGEDQLSAAEVGGQILMEEEMLERAISAEREGESAPRTALENWSAYLEGFPDGTRASEAKRKVSHWRAVVKRDDALTAAISRDRKGNNDPTARIRDWNNCLSTYGNTPAIRAHAEERLAFWKSMLQQTKAPNFPYWASLRLEDGRTFSGKVVAENDQELKMDLPNRMKMNFRKGDYELIDSDHINGKRVECEKMRLASGVTTDQPAWGREDGITILGEERSGVETLVSFRVTGFYHFEVMARASKIRGSFPSVILSLNGGQQERIRFDSEEWKLYKVTFPFRIPAGEQRLEIVYPSQFQTMRDKRIVSIDYFTTAMVQ